MLQFRLGNTAGNAHHPAEASGENLENRTTAIGAMFCQLEELAKELNTAIWLVHHFKKGSAAETSNIDAGSGSGVFGRAPDVLFSIHPLQGEEHTYTIKNDVRYWASACEPHPLGTSAPIITLQQRSRCPLLTTTPSTFWIPSGVTSPSRSAGCPPFAAQVILNGHEWVACEARRAAIPFKKESNCFTEISDAAGLAEIADTLSAPAAIGRLYLCLGTSN